MNAYKLLSLSLLAVLLGGTAGYAVAPKCTSLKVNKNAFYGIKVTYKKCGTGTIETERMEAVPNASTKTFSLDPSINSTDQLKITGIWLKQDHLWQADSATSNWTVGCGGSVDSPECKGTPDVVTNCEYLYVQNKGVYTAQVVYTECRSKNHMVSELRSAEDGKYWVEDNTKIRVDMRSGGRIWPQETKDEGQDIGKGYTIYCSGHTWDASCNAIPTR